MTATDQDDAQHGPGRDQLFTRQGLRGPAWLAVVLPPLGLVLLWLASGAADGAFASASSALRAAGTLLGLAGYATFATDLVLGARIPSLERLFGRLDRMYRFHRRLGAFAAGLLAAHLLAMAGSRTVAGSPVVGLFLPDPGLRVFAGVLALALMAAVLTVTILTRLRHEVFLRVHRLLGLAFAIAALHVLRVPTAAGRPASLTGYLAVLTAAGGAAWIYRSGLGRTLVSRHYYRVARIRRVHPRIVEVALTPVEDPLSFAPGQHVFLAVDDQAVRREQHPFSITSAPDEPELRLAVKSVGDYTGALGGVSEGSWATVEGPYGGFWHNGRRLPRQIWIAGGIGVTPFLSMARSLDGTAAPDIDLYYCTDDVADAVFLGELTKVANRVPTLRVILVPADEEGLLTVERVASRSDLSDAHVFLCGPPAMIEAMTAQFASLGFPRRRLHDEQFRLRPS